LTILADECNCHNCFKSSVHLRVSVIFLCFCIMKVVNIDNCHLQVTDNHNIVLTQDGITETFASDVMIMHIRRLVRERDEYLQVGFL
jgi:hypothetical protein